MQTGIVSIAVDERAPTTINRHGAPREPHDRHDFTQFSLTLTQDDLTVEPMPGELTAFAKRMAASIPAPFAPTAPLQHGQYTIVIFYEHSWTEDHAHPTRLRYGFATLDAEGKTQVLSAPEFAQVYESATQATELAREWEQEALRLNKELERDHLRAVRGPVKVEGRGYRLLSDEEVDRIIADDDGPGLRLEESSAAEVDELFEALSKNGRLAVGS